MRATCSSPRRLRQRLRHPAQDQAEAEAGDKDKEELVLAARLAAEAGRFEDMAAAARAAVEAGGEVSQEEGQLLGVAYRSVAGSRRREWRVVSAIIDKDDGHSDVKLQIANRYREEIGKELCDICDEVLSIMDNFILQKVSDGDQKIFFLKMRADFHRYKSEVERSGGVRVHKADVGVRGDQGEGEQAGRGQQLGETIHCQ